MTTATTEPREFWHSATTLDDLAAGVVRWLQGEIPETPTYGPPEEETAAIRHHLIALNQCGGVLTDDSQPGEVGEHGRQRALVSGYCTKERAGQLRRLTSDPGLLVVIRPPYDESGDPGWDEDGRIPATETTTGEACTWAGGFEDPDEVEAVWSETVSDDVVDAVMSAYRFCAVDLTWGREHLLWERLAAVLGITGGTREEVTAHASR